MSKPELPSSLRNQMRKGRVIPFAGAGVSMAVMTVKQGDNEQEPLFPSWKELFERGADELDEHATRQDGACVRALLDVEQPNYFEAARHLRDRLGKCKWADFLRRQLNPCKAQADEQSLGLAKCLWKLGNQLVITTNYDSVLEWACPDQDPEVWSVKAVSEIPRFLRGSLDRRVVWHLHGRVGDPTSVVFAPDDYVKLHGQGNQIISAAITGLRYLLVSHTLLFVGFSFSDSYFNGQLEWLRQTFEGYEGEHYALIESGRKGDFEKSELPVRPIYFGDYTDLPSILSDWADEANVERRKTRLPPVRISTDRLIAPCEHFVGRDNELRELDKALQENENVVTITADRGQGKTALVCHWLGELSRNNEGEVEAVFGWTFRTLTSEREDKKKPDDDDGDPVGEPSADLFMDAALRFFGANPAGSPSTSVDGLVKLIRKYRTVLVLDRLDVMYDSKGDLEPTLLSLVRKLVESNKKLPDSKPCLCVIIARPPLKLPSVQPPKQIALSGISEDSEDSKHAVAELAELLRLLGVNARWNERREMVKEAKGCPLTLTLAGHFLHKFCKGRIDSDGLILAKSPTAIIEAHECQLKEPTRKLLRLLAMYDGHLELEDVQSLCGLLQSGIDWDGTIAELCESDLSCTPALDMSPSVRRYVRESLKRGENEEKENEDKKTKDQDYRDLYEFFKKLVPVPPSTLEGMTPPFAAVHYGCKAGQYPDVWDNVLVPLIQQGKKRYCTRELGAFREILRALSWFTPILEDSKSDIRLRAQVHAEFAATYRPLGMLTKASESMKEAVRLMEVLEDSKDFDAVDRKFASWCAGHLAEIQLLRGEPDSVKTPDGAEADGAIANAMKAGNWASKTDQETIARNHTLLGAIQCDCGEFEAADDAFSEALKADSDLKSTALYRSWDHLFLRYRHNIDFGNETRDLEDEMENMVFSRAATIEEELKNGDFQTHSQPDLRRLEEPLAYLYVGRSRRIESLMKKNAGDDSEAWTCLEESGKHLESAIDGLRNAGRQDYLIVGLLERATLRRASMELDDRKDQQLWDGAIADLNEAERLAWGREPPYEGKAEMPFHLVDCYLEQARLQMGLGNFDKADGYAKMAKKLIEGKSDRRHLEITELEDTLPRVVQIPGFPAD